jgi:lysozyme family protein
MAMFSPALEVVLKNEGGLTEAHPSDPGGITNFGISLRFLKSVVNPSQYGIHDHEIDADTIRNLTPSQAAALYQGEFWNTAPFASISDQDVCNYLFDMGVNLGIAPAVKCCQRAVWAVWNHYRVMSDDGILGHDTLMWIERCKPDRLISCMRSERAGEYRLIAQKHPEQMPEMNGWLTRAYGNHP